ncbi:alpha/beta hydrolase [Streptomyces cinnamoneus]|uniref:Alpha/beta hydrolase n=1 Tax=Streptomyces cinnamoneus TaxID=53446 RepID=A0A2G1XKW3_STRCJ|nr:alpha/beta fold hydrolase [Streptomyces cinnamoneus]PHQ51856.1 alpha/beta hydrolase [Streptomyces cinnamoneus]PPT16320.1 alpha/beta hydrolase [Streptomyces cinnamoneus]
MTRDRGGDDRSVGRYVSEELRDRYFEACEAVMGLGPMPREEVDVETDFGTTHVYLHGPRVGPDARTPVVLVHGAGGNSAQWYPNVAALAGRRPVYAVDTLGDPGRSVQRAPIHEPEDAARWLEQVLDGLGLDRVHLVGHSYGGWLALNQAHRAPGRLASVTLLDPGGLEKTGLRFYAWIFVSALGMVAPVAIRRRLAAWLDQPVLVVPELRAMIWSSLRAFRIRRPSPLPLTEAELRTIRTPLCLLLGERSLLVHPARQAERLPRLVPTARAEIIADTGHGPNLDHAGQVNARMVAFMDAVD